MLLEAREPQDIEAASSEGTKHERLWQGKQTQGLLCFFLGVCLCRNKPTPEVNLVVSLTDLVTSVLKFPSCHICPGQCQEPHSETSSFCSTEDPAVPGSQCMAHHHRRSAVKGLRSACAVTFWESYTLTSACQGFCVSLTSSQILKYPQVLASHVVSLLWSGRILPVRTLIAPEPFWDHGRLAHLLPY